MKKALLYTAVFAAIQLLVSSVAQVIWVMMDESKSQPMSIPMLMAALTVSNLLAIGVFLLAKWSVVSRHWVQTRPWGALFWCVLAALGAIIPSTWLQEQMPELPNVVEEQMGYILQNRWGYVLVGLLAPLAEELVFRGAVLRALLRWQRSPWVGIAISAFLFALIHMNPAQMPHAFLIGLLLGWMYYRTDSIVPGVVYHWVNNTVAYVFYNLYPDPSLKLADLFGGNEQAVWMALGFSLCIFLPALFQMKVLLRKDMA